MRDVADRGVQTPPARSVGEVLQPSSTCLVGSNLHGAASITPVDRKADGSESVSRRDPINELGAGQLALQPPAQLPGRAASTQQVVGHQPRPPALADQDPFFAEIAAMAIFLEKGPSALSPPDPKIPFHGSSAFGVKVDSSRQLDRLLERAEGLRPLAFPAKLAAVKSLALEAMNNAFDEGRWDIVNREHTLGHALQERYGCCRYQAVLFLLLGAKAQLGDRHYLQSAEIEAPLNTCFNEVHSDGQVHLVSIFQLSSKEPNRAYRIPDGTYTRPHRTLPGETFLAYVQDGGEVALKESRGHHFDFVQTSAGVPVET